MKIPKLPFSLPAITGRFKKEQDELKEPVPEQEADRIPSTFQNRRSRAAEVRIEEQLRGVLRQHPPPAGSSTKAAQHPRSLAEIRDPMSGKERSDDALPAYAAKVTAESTRARKMASALSRLRSLPRQNLFSQKDIEAIQQALQEWVLEAKADTAELQSRGEAARTFIRVLHDPSMNMPRMLTDQFSTLSSKIQGAIRKVEDYHGRRNS